MGLTQAQNIMLTRLEVYCIQHDTGAWIGNGSDLDAIGGKALLYELEQGGVVTINRIGEKWIVCPDRGAGVNITDKSFDQTNSDN